MTIKNRVINTKHSPNEDRVVLEVIENCIVNDKKYITGEQFLCLRGEAKKFLSDNKNSFRLLQL